ncbi:J domain-containing protein [Glaciihabitans sp. dw_435]|uniref:J domain-containing protein n=1 Tax=Glaciihabitans sp. dw_435 TaxID=2720081 RepID=UPI001BD56C4B|nr:J domain-containing protein [Glaciihabitans sp. dw_435]
MSSSPISASPYEVLGVSPTVETDELRRAYRRMLRETHPDTGGVAVDFHAVQWAWEKIGTPGDRAAYDRGAGSSRSSASGQEQQQTDWAPSEGYNARGTRPSSTIYGDAGGWYRERYLQLLREWRGTSIAKPYDPQLVRSAPAQIRAVLATAIAVEASAQALDSLGIGYTIWHGIATTTAAPGLPDETLDHIVLGASGLFALASRDWGGTVRTRKGELIGAVLAEEERPVHRLSVQARFVAKACSVAFTALVIVIPDGSSAESLEVLGSIRGTPTLLVWRSRLPHLMRTGLGTLPFRGGAEVFDIRTRLRAGIRFA